MKPYNPDKWVGGNAVYRTYRKGVRPMISWYSFDNCPVKYWHDDREYEALIIVICALDAMMNLGRKPKEVV